MVSENTQNFLSKAQSALLSAIDVHFSGRLSRLPDHAWTGYGLSYLVSTEDIKGVFKDLKSLEPFCFDMLVDITAVDWMDDRDARFDLVYQLMSLKYRHRVTIKVEILEDVPCASTVSDLWQSALFMEREVWDMFGICFSGHPDLRRILMYEEFKGYPLRKDYPKALKQPRVVLRSPEVRNTSKDMKRPSLKILASNCEVCNDE